MEQPINEPFTSEESQEIYQNFKTIINSRLDKLYNSKGSDGEQYAYSIAVKQMRKKQADKLAEPTPEEPMEQGDKLKEMIQSALSKPLSEKKKSSSFTSQYDDKFTDGRKKLPDGLQKSILKKQGNLDEDIDLGHEDNEPHMLKADLYRIGKYAMELYKMVDQFEGEQEVDFPHWWQSKIVQAKSMLVSAKHYLDFETKEPQIDAMVDVASEEGALGENLEDIDYRNRNNIMRGVYDLAKKSKDVESFKDKWYEIYSRGPQDKDADTDEWLEKTYTRVMSRVATEEMTPEKSEKIGMPFKGIAKEGEIDEMSKKQIKKRGKVFDALKDQGMPDKKAGPIATSVAMKEEIKKAILAKLKNK